MVRQIFHPNVNRETGEICEELLGKSWSPETQMKEVLTKVHTMLATPDADSPVDEEITRMFKENPKKYKGEKRKEQRDRERFVVAVFVQLWCVLRESLTMLAPDEAAAWTKKHALPKKVNHACVVCRFCVDAHAKITVNWWKCVYKNALLCICHACARMNNSLRRAHKLTTRVRRWTRLSSASPWRIVSL